MFEMMWTRSGLKLVSCGETGEEKSISFFTAPRGNGTGALVLYAATREVIKEGWFTLFFFFFYMLEEPQNGINTYANVMEETQVSGILTHFFFTFSPFSFLFFLLLLLL